MFSEEGMPVHFAAVGFRDFPDVRQRKHWFELQDFNLLDEAHEDLSNWLLNINAFGGGSNFGESGIAALVKGLQDVTWPDARRRVAALFTDDKSHMPDHGVDTWDDVKKAIRDSDTEQIHLFTTEREVESDELTEKGHLRKLAKENLKMMDDPRKPSVSSFGCPLRAAGLVVVPLSRVRRPIPSTSRHLMLQRRRRATDLTWIGTSIDHSTSKRFNSASTRANSFGGLKVPPFGTSISQFAPSTPRIPTRRCTSPCFERAVF